MSGIELQKILSKNIKIYMTMRDVTQRDLAANIGMSPASLSQKMSGVVRWNVDDIANASSFLQVKPEALLSSQLVAGHGFEPWTSGL